MSIYGVNQPHSMFQTLVTCDDAAALELAKTTATKFAADVMNIRKSEDIHELTNWISEDLVFNMCDSRHFVALVTQSLIDETKYPKDLTLEVENAFTREDILSMIVKANGFVFETDDKLILEFKKQEDGTYKLSYGTITTCTYQ
ncbi:hypothetical protein GCK72_008450 [Caenorhabditis remanei]|uniref:Uncharacterized protein n=1 Tax=Caenorhabditis remanei TaxID=31234 RepID=A0A6A5H0B0_CAERE|nr:hypothetical protein GCK72_008450 [Caenorhabditis remanei]KAF1760204.1 hypothetical protein GCK72_008450 [Caenorhabditis remanei]